MPAHLPALPERGRLEKTMTLTHDLGSRGILFFPVTPFRSDGAVDLEALVAHVEGGLAHEPEAVFAACGTGEFSALDLDEHRAVVSAVVEVVAGRVPVLAGAGYGTALATAYTESAAAAGADGVLLFPPAGASGQRGLAAHYALVAERSPLPVILYQRDGVVLTDETVRRLLDSQNIVGLKDGTGDLERLGRTVLLAEDRWTFFNGMPTAELSARAFGGIGVRAYSSAVFAFLPEVAVRFRQAFATGDETVMTELMRDFYGPLGALRESGPGYAVGLVKAGVTIRGIDAGVMRAPGQPVAAEHLDELRRLIDRGLELVA
jgi:5-dehydro-4-deoxyglucarate dehydratase